MTPMNPGRTYHDGLDAIRPWLAILRVYQCSMTGLLGVVGYEVQSAQKHPLSPKLCGVFAFIFLACASANIINDIRDFKTDSIQHPMRPLPSGRISRSSAWVAFVIATGSSLALGSLFGWSILLIDSCVIAIGVIYSVYLKGTVLLGNLTVAGIGPLALPVGAFVHGTPSARVFLAYGLIVLYMFSFEILKTLRDREGDKAAGYHTVAVIYGAQASVYALRACMTGLVAATLSLVVFQEAWFWPLALLVCTILPSAVLAYALPASPKGKEIVFTLKGMRIAWITGIVTIGIWLWQAR